MIRAVIIAALLVGTAAPTFAAEQTAATAVSRDQDDPIGGKLSERLGPYMQASPFPVRKDETLAAWKKEYERLAVEEKAHYCVFQLRNESWSECDRFWSDAPYSKEPEATASRELVKLGRHAMPQLLRAVDSRISTKIHPSRHMRDPWLVQDAALDAIERIACSSFGSSAGVFKLSHVEEGEREKICKNVAAWWEQNKGSDEVQWAKEALLSETTAHGEDRGMAIDSLYRRLGKESYPFLAKAYHRLPKGREDVDAFDKTRGIKIQILQWLLKAPTTNEKAVFASAVEDAPLWIRIDGAEGLWAIGDPSGLETMVRESEDRLLKDSGSASRDSEYCNLVSFLVRCNTPHSRETVYKCLGGRNPYLRQEAIRSVPSLRMEKAVRALPDLFDDPFVLGGSYTEYCGNTARTVPPRRVCDEAAKTFAQVVPDAPRFDGSTAAEQQNSIEKLKQWWKKNGPNLTWDEKHGILVRPAKEFLTSGKNRKLHAVERPAGNDRPAGTTVDPRIGEWVSAGEGSPRSILILRANGQFSMGDLENGQTFPDGVTGTWAAEKDEIVLTVKTSQSCKVREGETAKVTLKVRKDGRCEMRAAGQEEPVIFDRESAQSPKEKSK